MKEKRRISEYVIFWLKRGVSTRVLNVSVIKKEIINNNHSMFEQKYNFGFLYFCHDYLHWSWNALLYWS